MGLGEKGCFAHIKKLGLLFFWETYITSGFIIKIWRRVVSFWGKDIVFYYEHKFDSSMEILLSANSKKPVCAHI